MSDSGDSPGGISTPRSFHVLGMLCCHASRMPGMNVFGPPSSSTCGCSVLPRVSTVRFWSTMASNSDAISSSVGVSCFWRPLMSVSANTPHLPATLCSLMPRYPCSLNSLAGMRSFALILSMTAPVPPAHLSFIDGIFFLRPLCWSSLKTMILASCPPSSTTELTSGWSFSTARETAVTSWTNLAPTRGASEPAPEPVMKIRQLSASMPRSNSSRRRNSSAFSGCLVS